MSSVAIRRLAIAGVAALAVATPISAYAAPHGHGGAHATKASHASKTNHGKKHHGKPAPKHFTAVGTVTAVDAAAGTVTLADKGGSKDLHGKSVTVVVTSTTKLTRDDANVTLDKVQAGDHVSANGNRGTDGSLNARHVNAESPAAPDASESATPEPTESATPEATQSADATVAPQPTDTASATTTG